ncbi:hypothetical protein ACVWXO_010183 [Bradyrhizobium sp. LM2.7]
MTAGVHLAGNPGGVRQVGLLLDRQRVHVGAQADRLEPLAGRLVALDHADHASLAEARHDFIAAELTQAVRNECCGAVNVIQELGVLMDVPPPGLDIGLKVGDAVHDGHGWVSSFVGNTELSTMQAPVHPTAAEGGLALPARHGRACTGPLRLPIRAER